MSDSRRGRARRPRTHARQRGVVLILAVLLLVVGAGVFVASDIGGDRARLARESAEHDVLVRARNALLQRALTDANKPGSLPCPDENNDGVAELNPCGVGRLPWRTLDIDDLRDRSGERLWYVLSDAFGDNATPLNSETPGQLAVDGAGGIAALLIAPGAPLGGQDDRTGAPNDPAQFLEGENADADLDFTALTDGSGNDRVLAITAEQLMQRVHTRVLRTVDVALREHMLDNGFSAYPWAAPFDNPRTALYRATAGTREGLLALSCDATAFATDYTVQWDLAGAGVQGPTGTLDPVDLARNQRTVTATRCTRTTAGALGRYACDAGTAVQSAGLPPGVATRTFEFDVPEFAPLGSVASAAGPASVATTTLSVPLAPQGEDEEAAEPPFVIRLTDRDAGGAVLGGGIITRRAALAGSLTLAGIDLVPATERWVCQHAWQRLLYVAFAPGLLPGGAGACTPGTDCLTLLDSRAPLDDKPGVVLLAGADLSGNRALPVVSEADYFEADNATPGDGVFRGALPGAGFNDAALALRPPPP